MRGVEYTMKKIIIFGIFLVCFLMLIMPSVSSVYTTCNDAEEKIDDLNIFSKDILGWLQDLIKFLVKLFFPVTIWD